jgi:hypothetical protein
MKLLTKALEKALPKLYDTQDTPCGDKKLYVKLFCPWGQWTWYIAEYNPETRECFGLVDGFEPEWGYFSLDELEQIRGPGRLAIERDLYFTPKKAGEL